MQTKNRIMSVVSQYNNVTESEFLLPHHDLYNELTVFEYCQAPMFTHLAPGSHALNYFYKCTSDLFLSHAANKSSLSDCDGFNTKVPFNLIRNVSKLKIEPV